MTNLLITQSSGHTKVSEAGGIDTYKLRLAEAPVAPVVVTVKTDRHILIADPNQPLYRPLKLMPIGDSITYGVINSVNNTRSGGYRTYLWRKLNAQGYSVNFVGSQSSGPRSIDRDHEGYRGKTISGIAGALNRDVAKYQPDVVLLLAGTNDILKNRDLNQAPQRLQRLMHQILRQAPQTAVLVGTLPPNTRSSDNPDQIDAFNTAIVRLIERQRTRSGQQIQFVDLFHAIEGNLSDQTHPTAQGYRNMARVWYRSLLAVLHSPTAMSLSSKQTFTFTPRNWQIAQTVTVVAQPDLQATGSQASLISHQLKTEAGDNQPDLILPVKVVDDDAAILLEPLESNLQEGDSDRYQVRLSSKPEATVTVRFTANRQLRLPQSKLVFYPNQWQQSQTLRVKARADSEREGLHRGVIRYRVQSQDFHYRNLADDRWVLPIADQTMAENQDDTDKLLQTNRNLPLRLSHLDQTDDLLTSGSRIKSSPPHEVRTLKIEPLLEKHQWANEMTQERSSLSVTHQHHFSKSIVSQGIALHWHTVLPSFS